MILVTASPDAEFHREIVGALQGRFRFDGHWQVGYGELTRLRTASPDQQYVLALDFTDPARAMVMARAIDSRSEFATLAVGGGGTREDLLQLMQVGIRDVVPHDSPEELRQATRRAVSKLTSPEELRADLCAFLPAKPGCGATTLATHAMSVAARLTSEPTLLLDFDLRLGVTSFLLKASGHHTIVDALREAHHLDPDLWASLVTQAGKLHLIGSGPVNYSQHFPPESFADILQFAVQIYSYVAVDLPGTMEAHEVENPAALEADLPDLHDRYRSSPFGAPEIGVAAGSGPDRKGDVGFELR